MNGDALRRRAVELGASDAALLAPEQVVTGEWVRARCLHGGCVAGLCLTCPPHSPAPAQTRALLDEYESVLLLRFDVGPEERARWRPVSRWVLDVSLRLERELFLAGHVKALALCGGRPCRLDEPCGRPAECAFRASLRPGPAGCGIDVFATSSRAGWPLAVVRGPDDPYHRYALVLVE